jgi:hypothetical protein
MSLRNVVISTSNYTVSCPRGSKCLYPPPWEPYASLISSHTDSTYVLFVRRTQATSCVSGSVDKGFRRRCCTFERRYPRRSRYIHVWGLSLSIFTFLSLVSIGPTLRHLLITVSALSVTRVVLDRSSPHCYWQFDTWLVRFVRFSVWVVLLWNDTPIMITATVERICTLLTDGKSENIERGLSSHSAADVNLLMLRYDTVCIGIYRGRPTQSMMKIETWYLFT